MSLPLAAAGVPGAAKAFETLRPGAFKADLWRYAILWGCGGIYVDSKMRLVSDWADFIENSQRQFGFSFESSEPALLTCLADSRNFTSAAMPRCNGYPRAS